MTRSRRVLVFAVLGVVGLAVVGWLAGRQVRSPAQIAADTAPPKPSPITVPIVRRSLAAEVVEDVDAIEGDLTKRMEAIVGPLPGPMPTGPPAGQRPRPYDRAALSALQREEVATATSELRCEEKHIAPVEAVVRPEYEARFREQNLSLIRSVKAVWR